MPRPNENNAADANDDLDYDKVYDDAFDEAAGEPPTTPEGDDDVDDAANGGEAEPPEGSGDAADGDDSGEEGAGDDAGDAGEADGDDAGEGEGQGDVGDDSGDDDADVGGEAAGEAASTGADDGQGDATAGDGKFDEATLKRAMDLLKQQQQGNQPGSGEDRQQQPAGDQGEQGSDDGLPPIDQRTYLDYVPEDKKALVQKYEEEWSEVSEAEQIKRNAELQLLEDRLYSNLNSALAPVFETTQSLKVNAHLDRVKQSHPDLDEIREDLFTWIEAQPEFVRPAYLEVAQKGSADQVIELLNQYKASQGTTGAVPDVPASSARTQDQRGQQQQRPRKQPPAAAKRALSAAPSPRKAEVPGSANPDDFDSAWEEAAGGV